MRYILSIVLINIFSAIAYGQSVDIRPYGAHVEILFSHPSDMTISQVISRIGQQPPTSKLISKSQDSYIQFLGTSFQDTPIHFTVIWDYNDRPSDTMVVDSVFMKAQTDDELLDMVQEYTFRYFWDFAHPVSGLIRERNTSSGTVTMGGTGFGIMSILVGIERGFVTREEGLERVNLMVNFLEVADRFKGVFPHWMDGGTGQTIPFSSRDNGGDLVETAFLFQGLLTARSYFNQSSAEEELLRLKITQLWEEVNWNWYRKQTQKVLFWHWSPEFGFDINLPIRGWNEAFIIYLLAIASPTHGIPPSLYHDGWANNNRFLNGSFPYGIELPLGPSFGGPLFFAHYSFLGCDPRFLKDDYTNYFVQNRNHTLINRAYCIDNPKSFIGYSELAWGLTASDDPDGYLAHEPGGNRDNGTISPTAAISSIPYTPEESIQTIRYFYEKKGLDLWGPMGFYDAYNPTRNWVADSYLAIDQGPIINMIENHRTGLLWKYFMENSEITAALDKMGFVKDSTGVSNEEWRVQQIEIYPNPVRNRLSIDLVFQEDAHYIIYSIEGKLLRQGIIYNDSIDLESLTEGIYYLKIQTSNRSFATRFVKY